MSYRVALIVFHCLQAAVAAFPESSQLRRHRQYFTISNALQKAGGDDHARSIETHLEDLSKESPHPGHYMDSYALPKSPLLRQNPTYGDVLQHARGDGHARTIHTDSVAWSREASLPKQPFTNVSTLPESPLLKGDLHFTKSKPLSGYPQRGQHITNKNALQHAGGDGQMRNIDTESETWRREASLPKQPLTNESALPESPRLRGDRHFTKSKPLSGYPQQRQHITNSDALQHAGGDGPVSNIDTESETWRREASLPKQPLTNGSGLPESPRLRGDWQLTKSKPLSGSPHQRQHITNSDALELPGGDERERYIFETLSREASLPALHFTTSNIGHTEGDEHAHLIETDLENLSKLANFHQMAAAVIRNIHHKIGRAVHSTMHGHNGGHEHDQSDTKLRKSGHYHGQMYDAEHPRRVMRMMKHVYVGGRGSHSD